MERLGITSCGSPVLAPRRPRAVGKVALAVLALVTAWTAPAHAYVDFGVGSHAFQIVIAWGLALVFALRVFWVRILTFLRKLLGR